MNDSRTETVICSKCQNHKVVQAGVLSEAQKNHWVCQVCAEEPVVERQVDAHQTDGKELLLEG